MERNDLAETKLPGSQRVSTFSKQMEIIVSKCSHFPALLKRLGMRRVGRGREGERIKNLRDKARGQDRSSIIRSVLSEKQLFHAI
jgi:hypothetical protein